MNEFSKNIFEYEKEKAMQQYKAKFPKPGKKKKKSVKKATIKERDLQAMAEEYCNLRGAVYIRLPDTMLSSIYANNSVEAQQKALISSYIKGLPDMTIFHPTRKIGPYPAVLPLELKTESGKLSRAQEQWQDKINTVVARGWDEIKQAIDDFLDYTDPF